MKTLKELVEWQKMTDLSDLQIIRTWFIENNMESEGLSIIADLAESKTNKLQTVLDGARAWLPILPDLEKSNQGLLTKEQADILQKVITIFLLGMDLKESGFYSWAEQEIPKMKCPKIIFVPCVKWLKEKYGIRFKGDNDENI